MGEPKDPVRESFVPPTPLEKSIGKYGGEKVPIPRVELTVLLNAHGSLENALNLVPFVERLRPHVFVIEGSGTSKMERLYEAVANGQLGAADLDFALLQAKAEGGDMSDGGEASFEYQRGLVHMLGQTRASGALQGECAFRLLETAQINKHAERFKTTYERMYGFMEELLQRDPPTPYVEALEEFKNRAAEFTAVHLTERDAEMVKMLPKRIAHAIKEHRTLTKEKPLRVCVIAGAAHISIGELLRGERGAEEPALHPSTKSEFVSAEYVPNYSIELTLRLAKNEPIEEAFWHKAFATHLLGVFLILSIRTKQEAFGYTEEGACDRALVDEFTEQEFTEFYELLVAKQKEQLVEVFAPRAKRVLASFAEREGKT